MAIITVVVDRDRDVVGVSERPAGTVVEQLKEAKSLKDLVGVLRGKDPIGVVADGLATDVLIYHIRKSAKLTDAQKAEFVNILAGKTPLDQMRTERMTDTPTNGPMAGGAGANGDGGVSPYITVIYYIDP